MKLRDFGELAALKARMEQARREAAEREAAEAAERRRLERERNLFKLAVGEVRPLKDRGLAPVARPRPEPVARQHQADEQAALAQALSDEFDVESLLETDAELSFRRPGVPPDVLKRLRRGQWAIQAQLDLHGLRRDEARERLADFVRDASQRGLRCLRVVHGKGNGSPARLPVLKGKVRGWLVQKREVIAFTQARAAEGGAGALVVLLEGRPRSGGG